MMKKILDNWLILYGTLILIFIVGWIVTYISIPETSNNFNAFINWGNDSEESKLHYILDFFNVAITGSLLIFLQKWQFRKKEKEEEMKIIRDRLSAYNFFGIYFKTFENNLEIIFSYTYYLNLATHTIDPKLELKFDDLYLENRMKKLELLEGTEDYNEFFLCIQNHENILRLANSIIESQIEREEVWYTLEKLENTKHELQGNVKELKEKFSQIQADSLEEFVFKLNDVYEIFYSLTQNKKFQYKYFEESKRDCRTDMSKTFSLMLEAKKLLLLKEREPSSLKERYKKRLKNTIKKCSDN